MSLNKHTNRGLLMSQKYEERWLSALNTMKSDLLGCGTQVFDWMTDWLLCKLQDFGWMVGYYIFKDFDWILFYNLLFSWEGWVRLIPSNLSFNFFQCYYFSLSIPSFYSCISPFLLHILSVYSFYNFSSFYFVFSYITFVHLLIFAYCSQYHFLDFLICALPLLLYFFLFIILITILTYRLLISIFSPPHSYSLFLLLLILSSHKDIQKNYKHINFLRWLWVNSRAN